MGFLDKIVGGIVKGSSSSQKDGSAGPGGDPGALLDAVTGLLGGSSAVGGLSGLVGKLESSGLGEVVSSWVGKGANLPITVDQIEKVLGSDRIQEIARKVGLSPSELSAKLAHLLPQAVDHVTPDGSVPDAAGLEKGLATLKEKLGG